MATVIKSSTKPGPGRARAQDTDRHVGARMRERRIMLGLTQHQMAELIGVTYQQAHKYEKGINRVAAGRLYHIAQALGVEVGYFFEGLGRDNAFKATPQQRLLLELGRNVTPAAPCHDEPRGLGGARPGGRRQAGGRCRAGTGSRDQLAAVESDDPLATTPALESAPRAPSSRKMFFRPGELGHGSSRLLVLPVREAEAFRG
jgi:transcriptional regulator with XRE-family HTH domain